ncbi:SafA/ExsA family spore coat assembly protein [Bacillus sp. JJ1122]|uniref:SafA/ExsA family spore coat assembly protein n=1 Tax=Bacillus sp. JJ1122 TaxID=3122951 RepID=UPI002FFFFBCC
MKLHIVQKGDTLWKIAKKYGVNFEELKKMNAQLSNPDMIMPGMKIKVPTGGGNIKKEAPISGGTPQAKINMGGKKEMPIAKEKPISMPEVKKEAPVKELPKEAPVKEQPKMEIPKMELPKQEAPKPIKKEEAVKPYTPKMPKQIMPEIDINNYYMLNMSNMQLPPKPQPQPKAQPKEQPKALPKEQPKAQLKPQLPPKPENIFPEIKPEVKPEVKPQAKPMPKAEVKPSVKSEIKPNIKIEKNDFMDESPSMMPFIQGGYQQPMIPYPYNCYPGAPSMTGPGYGYPGTQQMMPYPQVQGAMNYPGQYPGMMPGMGMADLESSSFEQNMQMPLSPVMDENMPANMQPQVSPESEAGPTFYGTPISPVMPGPGWCPPYGQMPHGYPPMPYMPQVGGMMQDQMPYQPQVGGMMDNQMPQVSGMMDNQMMPQVGGMMDEESSEMPMPQMPQMGGMMENQMPPQMPQVGGMMENQMPPQMPQVGGMMQGQMPMMPQVGGMMQGQMPMMPQVGGMMQGQMPMMPQVGGMMQGQMPMMPQVGGMMQGQMPHQMPQVGGMMENQMPPQMPQVGGMQQPPLFPKQGVKGMGNDCGCGGSMGTPYGLMGAGYPPHAPQGYPSGPGMYQFQPQPGYQMGMGPQGFMNPYGAGPMGPGFGMPRFDDESDEY